MGCGPSCSVPCCSLCDCSLNCCGCCPCFRCCGCWCRDRRCHCRCDPFRKYADGGDGQGTGTSGEAGGRTGRAANVTGEDEGSVAGVPPDARDTESMGTAAACITDPVLGIVIRPSSSVSQSTGMEPQFSGDSRSPSMLSDASDSDAANQMKDGVCIDGKFYPRPTKSTATATMTTTSAAKEGHGLSFDSEFTITNIISVQIGEKSGPSASGPTDKDRDIRKPWQDEPSATSAPRRLAKIDIKEERKKMMSELSRFKKKKPKRRKQRKRDARGGRLNEGFDDLNDPVTQMEMIEKDLSSESPPSLRVSSASDDPDLPSRLENVRTVKVVSSAKGSAPDKGGYQYGVKETHTKDIIETLVVDNLSSTSPQSSSSHPEEERMQGEDRDTDYVSSKSAGYSSSSRAATNSMVGSEVEASVDEPALSLGDETSNPASSGVGESNASLTSQVKASPRSTNDASRIQKLAKSRYAVAPAPNSLPPRAKRPPGVTAGLFAAVSRSSNLLSRQGERAARGLAMSRHFQGQGHQLNAFPSGGSAAGSSGAAAVRASGGAGGATNTPPTRPMSALVRHMTAGSSSLSRHDSLWTLAGDAASADQQELAGSVASSSIAYDSRCTGNSGTNSDGDSVASSSQARPASTYGIRPHSEAVHSLQRWRNLKVNPF